MSLRSEFPVFERIAYLNAGSDGPLPAAASAAGREALDLQVSSGRTREHFEVREALAGELRSGYASLLGAPVEDVALTTSTSEGIGKVLTGLELRPGDEVLTSDQEHPGVIGPLITAQARGVRVRMAPLAKLADHIGDARVVVCSHVGWRSGEIADPRLGDAAPCLVMDGAQSVGAVPVSPAALGCAAYAGSGQKWLCGADGTGMLWIAPEWQDRIVAFGPAYEAFVDSAAGLGSDLLPDARRHDTPTLSRETLAISVASLGVLSFHGWDFVHARAREQAAWFAGELESRGFTVGPRGDTTLVSWEDPDPPAASARLSSLGVVVRYLPATRYLRASVGAWNDKDDLNRLLEAL